MQYYCSFLLAAHTAPARGGKKSCLKRNKTPAKTLRSDPMPFQIQVWGGEGETKAERARINLSETDLVARKANESINL
jgi:hypothetical protein